MMRSVPRGGSSLAGSFAGHSFDPEGRPLAADEFEARRDEWLPGDRGRSYLARLRGEAVTEAGRMANWIAPPRRGIDARSLDFEYVRAD
jgi:benzoyl-CoA 2,3-dioxygenase component B